MDRLIKSTDPLIRATLGVKDCRTLGVRVARQAGKHYYFFLSDIEKALERIKDRMTLPNVQNKAAVAQFWDSMLIKKHKSGVSSARLEKLK